MKEGIVNLKEHKIKDGKGASRVIKIILSVVLLIGLIIFGALKLTFMREFPELTSEPEVGKWYEITPDGAKSSDGGEWHGLFRKGSEDKVVVYFFGGGVSINEETSKRGSDFFTASMGYQDFVGTWGIGSNKEENQFKDWSFIVVPYSTGDFHAGTGVYQYTDEDGNKKNVYHNGYNNYDGLMKEAMKYLDSPDTLLVTGYSAGGFATSLLSDDVIERIPTAENVTVCVDSSLLLYDDWNKTANDLWKAPEEISNRIEGNNIVLDSLRALREKRGESVKILFDCSVRDNTLMLYQNYIDTGVYDKNASNKDNGDIFQRNLKQMVSDLQGYIPGSGVYIWDLNADKESHNTQHTILLTNDVFNKLEDDTSIAEWIMDAINGDVKSHGLYLLDEVF